MDCEGILGGEVPSKSHCQLLFRICGMHGGRTPVCPCQFESRPSLHDRDSFAELVKNEFKWNTNRTPLCLNEGNNYIYIHILYSHMYHHVSTVTLPWNPPANDSCPESSREHPLLYWPRAQHHRPAISARMRSSRWWLASWAPVLVRASWWIVLKKMNLNMWSLRTRWQSAEMSVYNDGGMVATGGQSRQGMARQWQDISPQSHHPNKSTVYNFGI